MTRTFHRFTLSIIWSSSSRSTLYYCYAGSQRYPFMVLCLN